MSLVDKNWGSIIRTALGEVEDVCVNRFLDAKVGDFSFIGSEKGVMVGEEDNKEMTGRSW